MVNNKQLSSNHRKDIPYFLATCGEWMEAMDISSGISLTDKFKVVVSMFNEQNSVSIRKVASVSDCRYISLNFDSINDRHWYSEAPDMNMAWTHSNMEATSCDMPMMPFAVLLCDGRTLECDETSRTSHFSILATIATFSAWTVCSNTPQCDEIVRSCFNCISHFDGVVVMP